MTRDRSAERPPLDRRRPVLKALAASAVVCGDRFPFRDAQYRPGAMATIQRSDRAGASSRFAAEWIASSNTRAALGFWNRRGAGVSSKVPQRRQGRSPVGTRATSCARSIRKRDADFVRWSLPNRSGGRVPRHPDDVGRVPGDLDAQRGCWRGRERHRKPAEGAPVAVSAVVALSVCGDSKMAAEGLTRAYNTSRLDRRRRFRCPRPDLPRERPRRPNRSRSGRDGRRSRNERQPVASPTRSHRRSSLIQQSTTTAKTRRPNRGGPRPADYCPFASEAGAPRTRPLARDSQRSTCGTPRGSPITCPSYVAIRSR